MIDLEVLVAASRVTLHGLGDVELDRDAPAARRLIAMHTRRPFGLPYHDIADGILAASAVPAVASEVIGALPEADRRRMMRKLATLKGQATAWEALRGSWLSWDERFFAVAIWAWRDEQARRHRAAVLNKRTTAALARAGGIAGVAPVAHGGLLALVELGRPFRRWEAFSDVPRKLDSLSSVTESMESFATTQRRLDQITGATSTGLAAVGQERSLTTAPFRADFTLPPTVRVLDVLDRARRASAAIHDNARLLRAAATFTGVTTPVRQIAGLEFADVTRAAAEFERRWQLDNLARQSFIGSPAAAGLSLHQVGPSLPALSLLNPLPAWWRDAFRLPFLPPEDPAEAAFYAQWEGDPLWFLVAEIEASVARRLFVLPQTVVLEVLYDALEAAVRSGPLVGWLRTAVGRAPYLDRNYRHLLDTALQFAAAADWVNSVTLLLVGLEHALSCTPQARLLIGSTKKFLAAEALIARLTGDGAQQKFVKTRVYGGAGNRFRHGRATDGYREQTLLSVVALAAWLDEHMKIGAVTRVVDSLSPKLGGDRG